MISKEFLDFYKQNMEWSKKNFGSGKRVGGITKHIEKELEEIRAKPYDLEEWIDVAILALDGGWRAGYSTEEVWECFINKIKKNFTRTYPMTSDDEPSEHIKEEVNINHKGGLLPITQDTDKVSIFPLCYSETYIQERIPDIKRAVPTIPTEREKKNHDMAIRYEKYHKDRENAKKTLLPKELPVMIGFNEGDLVD